MEANLEKRYNHLIRITRSYIFPNSELNSLKSRLVNLLRHEKNYRAPKKGDLYEFNDPHISSGSNEGVDYYEIIVSGMKNNVSENFLVVFLLIGRNTIHMDMKVEIHINKAEPELSKYVDSILYGLKPSVFNSDNTAKLLHLLPKTNRGMEKFKKAWKIWNRINKDYNKDKLEGNTNSEKVKIEDYRDRIFKETGWDVSERRLQTVIQLGEAGLLK